jgi:arylsulfatase A-like enzyme
MKSFFRIIISASYIIACLLYGVLFAEAAQEGRKPNEDYNIIFIFIDTLRADHLSCYGYERKTSPNIDELAEESVLFEQNFTPFAFTLGSFASLSTSLYPRSHGVFDIFKDKYPPRIKTLPEVLKLYGYDTVWFATPIASPHLEPGKQRGYETVGGYDKNLKKERRLVTNWLAKNKNKKFFLLFHTYKVHSPYEADLKYKKVFNGQQFKYKEIIETREELNKTTFEFIKDGLKNKEGRVWEMFCKDAMVSPSLSKLFEGSFSEKKMRAIEEFFKKMKIMKKWHTIKEYVYNSRISLLDVKAIEYLENLYDAAILQLDTDFIGPLLKGLKVLGLYDKSIIVIFSDHGEEFCEHGMLGHKPKLYDEIIHVPLIIRVPWIKSEKRVKELTQTVDIMPTLLDLLEIPIPHEAQGKSLVGLINETESMPIREYVFGQNRRSSSIRSREWKFILHNDGQKELYHLKSDLGEHDDLCQKEQSMAIELETKLREWEASLPSYKDQEYSFPPEIDVETQERIKKTGYW